MGKMLQDMVHVIHQRMAQATENYFKRSIPICLACLFRQLTVIIPASLKVIAQEIRYFL